MKKFNFKPLVNVRTQKDEFSENIFTTSVTGGFRIPPKAADKLGLKDYSAVSVFSDEDEETKEVTVYIAKGHFGTIKTDENGNPVTSGRNTTEFTDEDPIDGAIVRESTEGSKILTFTSAATWKSLGANKEKELELALESIGVMEYPLPSGKFVEGEVFQLNLVKERTVNARKPKASGENSNEDNEEEVEDVNLEGTDFTEEEIA